MTAKFKIGVGIALILTVVFSGIIAHGQAAQPTANNDALAVSLKMQTEQVQVGQMPWAILTVYNISDQPVIISDAMYMYPYRVYVYGKDGEAPTTLVQRQLTGRLRPGDAPLNYTLNVDSSIVVWPNGGPGDSCVRNFELAYLYDLSTPGRYTAYAEVMDPLSHRWLRTKTVTFEMMAPAQ
jgi:hypothetical protein